jgi:hypothetical protein
MDADRLYVSPRAAEKAGNQAIDNKEDGFSVKPRRKRNDDRTWDFGFVAILVRGGRPAGFA